KPGEVLRLTKRDRLCERAHQIFAKGDSNMLGRFSWCRNKLPERSRILGETKSFALLHLSIWPFADDDKVAKVCNDHEPVSREISADLFRVRRQPGVVSQWLHLNHAALGHLSLAWLALLELTFGVKAEIGMPSAGVAEIGKAKHLAFQGLANSVQECGE